MAPKFGHILAALGLLAIFLVVATLTPPAFATLTLGGHDFRVQVARTPEARKQGLSGTKSLARDNGMLFVFQNDATWQFWMKDMAYPIDIIWLDAHKQVVWVAADATPESFPRVFAPLSPARYVLELPAGSTQVKIGDTASF